MEHPETKLIEPKCTSKWVTLYNVVFEKILHLPIVQPTSSANMRFYTAGVYSRKWWLFPHFFFSSKTHVVNPKRPICVWRNDPFYCLTQNLTRRLPSSTRDCHALHYELIFLSYPNEWTLKFCYWIWWILRKLIASTYPDQLITIVTEIITEPVARSSKLTLDKLLS